MNFKEYYKNYIKDNQHFTLCTSVGVYRIEKNKHTRLSKSTWNSKVVYVENDYIEIKEN